MSLLRAGLPTLDIACAAGQWPEADARGWAERAIGAACTAVGLDLSQAEIAVLLTDDAAMRVLNAEHRGKNTPTNVLSFPAFAFTPDRLATQEALPGHPFLLGDLVFAAETVQREADALALALEAHLHHLIVHGFLHLLGYDHQIDADAELMESLERRILDGLGHQDPYG